MSNPRCISNCAKPCFLIVLFAVSSCAATGTDPQPTPPRSADQLLLDIMTVHSELATNEVFLAQAKIIGTYLEAALDLEEPERVSAYVKVLGILSQIKDATPAPPARSQTIREGAEASPSPGEVSDAKTIYEPGSALLEIYNAESRKRAQGVPAIRTYWKRDLAYQDHFLVPGREAEVGVTVRRNHNTRGKYVAKFSFYYEAQETGQYGFTVLHTHTNDCLLKVGDVDVVEAKPSATGQGSCSLEKGFHRVEFWLTVDADQYRWADSEKGVSGFEVRVLTPGGFDSVPLKKEMMLLKKSG